MDIGIDEVRYLGDGVYVKYDGYHLILTANSPTTDTIYLYFGTRQELRKMIDRVDVRENHGEA